MADPHEVQPHNFPNEVIYFDDNFAIAFGQWERTEDSLGIRYNHEEDQIGFPQVFGNPCWLMIPAPLNQAILSQLLLLKNGTLYQDVWDRASRSLIG